MRYRTFPGTNVTASEVGFGTWTLATNWWGEKTDAEAVAMLRSAHDDFGAPAAIPRDRWAQAPAGASKPRYSETTDEAGCAGRPLRVRD